LQAFAQDWLVLKLTNSGTMLGVTLAFQFLPMLIFSYYGGAISDRFSKLKILYYAQIAAGILALVLGILVLTNTVQLWMVFALAFLLGLVMTVANPAQQSFVFEMVGRDQIQNAISLWTMLIGLARIVGPAVAGILIATIGLGECFIINAISYIAVLSALLMIRTNELHSPSQPSQGKLMEGLKYIAKTPVIFTTLIMMAIVGTLTFEWQASLPLIAKFTFNGDAGTYSIISVALSVGMLIGGFITASTGRVSTKIISLVAMFFGFFLLLASTAPDFILLVSAFVIVGAFAISFGNMTNSIIQINADPQMRGRVMALWAAAFFGSTAIGGPIIGWVGEAFGPRWTLAVGGIAAVIAGMWGFYRVKKEVQERHLLIPVKK
jgi:MFS family permease